MSMYGTSNDFGKDMWLPLEEAYNYQFSNARGKFFSLATQDGRNFSDIGLQGRQYFVKLKIGDSLGGASIVEGGDWATPGDPKWDEGSVTLSLENHVIEFTGHEYELLRSNEAAARDVLPEKMESALDHQMRRVERQSWMDGTGKLANVASSDSTTITLDAVDSAQIDRDRYIWIDDANRAKYDVVHGTTGAQQETGLVFTNIAESTDVITTDQDPSSATSAGVVVSSGNWASGGAFRSLEFPGVLAAVDDGNTYCGINRATAGNGYWQATVADNSGTLRNLTTTLIHQLRNKVNRRSLGGMNPTAGNGYCWFANFGVWTSAHELMSPALRYTTGETPDIGWESFDLMGAPCYQDKGTPNCNLFLLRPADFKFLYAQYRQGSIFSWYSTPSGQDWFQKTASSGQGYADAVQRAMRGLIGMYTHRPRNHGRIDDLNLTAPAYAI